MFPINISDLVLHRGATVTIHVNDLAHLLLVLLASVVVASSSLPWAGVVSRTVLYIIAQTAFSSI